MNGHPVLPGSSVYISKVGEGKYELCCAGSTVRTLNVAQGDGCFVISDSKGNFVAREFASDEQSAIEELFRDRNDVGQKNVENNEELKLQIKKLQLIVKQMSEMVEDAERRRQMELDAKTTFYNQLIGARQEIARLKRQRLILATHIRGYRWLVDPGEIRPAQPRKLVPEFRG